MRRCRFGPLLGLVLIGLWFAAATTAMADTALTGAGSSFDQPFFSLAFFEYHHNHGDLTVDYQSIGSGGGIQQFTAKTVDFGASDVPLTRTEMKAAQAANGSVVQVPITLGGVVVAYNVPNVAGHIKLSPDVLADIFLGKITSWDDGRISKLNPGVTLLSLGIVVIHRAEGNGTTYIFTNYLSRVSPQWKSSVGNAKSVSWPAASSVGAKGNEGLAQQVRSTPGGIGYIELAYAVNNDIAYAALRNNAGQFVLPTAESVRSAAAQKANVNPADFSIVDQPGRDSYPICGYSWVMLWKNQADAVRGKALVDLFRWVVTDGQELAVKVRYVSLPPNIRAEAEKALTSIRT